MASHPPGGQDRPLRPNTASIASSRKDVHVGDRRYSRPPRGSPRECPCCRPQQPALIRWPRERAAAQRSGGRCSTDDLLGATAREHAPRTLRGLSEDSPRNLQILRCQNGESGKGIGGAAPRSKASRCRNQAPMPAAPCIQPVWAAISVGRVRCSACGQRIPEASRVADAEDLRADAAGEGERRGVAAGAMVGEEELGDAGRAAADADVVPEARRRLLGDAARDDRARRLRRPVEPGAIAGRLPQPIPEPRRAGRTVAPAEIVEAAPGLVGLVVEDQADVAVGPRDRLQVRRAGQRGVEERAVLRRLVERRQEIGDAGGAVREVGQELGRGAVHRPLAAARVVAAALQQPAAGLRRQRPRLGQIERVRGVEQEQPDARRARR